MKKIHEQLYNTILLYSPYPLALKFVSNKMLASVTLIYMRITGKQDSFQQRKHDRSSCAIFTSC